MAVLFTLLFTSIAGLSSLGSGAPSPPLCGAWCRTAPDDEACEVDKRLTSCTGEYCNTTCGLWSMNMLSGEKPPIPCAIFEMSAGYPIGTKPCRPDCLGPEVSPARWPLPLGLGLLCCNDECMPAVQRRHAFHPEYQCGVMQCPCNVFGSDCPDDWKRVTRLTKTPLDPSTAQQLYLYLSIPDWHAVMASFELGGATRIFVTHDMVSSDMPEADYSIASVTTPGVIELLSQTPLAYLHPNATATARAIRAMPNDVDRPGLVVNPSVGAFMNSKGTTLMGALTSGDSYGDRLLLVSTGVGLGAIRATVETLLKERGILSRLKQVIVYTGDRSVTHLPYRAHVEGWLTEADIETVVVLSRQDDSCSETDPLCATAHEASKRLPRLLAANPTVQRFVNGTSTDVNTPMAEQQMQMRSLSWRGGKIYVQHAVGLDMAKGGKLAADGWTFGNTMVVCVGRFEMVDQLPDVLRAVCQDEGQECRRFIDERLFQ